ncbi:MAG TPA: hypothetical protein VF331_26050 [Polyangiales bacterium]
MMRRSALVRLRLAALFGLGLASLCACSSYDRTLIHTEVRHGDAGGVSQDGATADAHGGLLATAGSGAGSTGGFGSAGGKGGGGGMSGATTFRGGAAGAPEGNATLVPLRGGCAGGRGGYGDGAPSPNMGRYAGAGGGGLQLSSAFGLTVASSGRITAAGGGGQKGYADEDGGGGSGGALLLEANNVSVDPNAWLTTNGGGGGAGHQDGNTAAISGDGGSGVSYSDATAQNGLGTSSPDGGRGLSCGEGPPCRYHDVAAGGRYGCGLRGPGEVLCWGQDLNGKLGDGTVNNTTTPVLTRLLSDAKQIAAGLLDGTHTCAVRYSGPIACWGYNGQGAVGDNSGLDRHVPDLSPGGKGGAAGGGGGPGRIRVNASGACTGLGCP